MKLFFNESPRRFSVNDIEIKDYGKIKLETDEMVSFKTQSQKEYDITAKEWGFYATPSINGRLKNEGFKTALVVNEADKTYVMLVEKDKLKEFKIYLNDNQNLKLLCWLDEFYPRIN